MPIQQWSKAIVVVDLADEPLLSEDLAALHERVAADGPVSVVVNMAAVRQVASSHLASLLHVRQKLVERGKRISLCCVPTEVASVMRVTRLDKVFEFAADVPTALASLQLGDAR